MSELRTNYEQLADSYDEDRKHWSVPRDENIAEIAARRVLDLGCGTGTYLAEQHGHFTHVDFVGVDLSAAMLAHAATKLGPLHLALATADMLPFADGSFDYVTSHYAFHHFPDKDAALAEVVRVLGHHGRFRIVNVEPYSLAGWWVFRFFDGAFENDMVRFWPPERIAAALEALGCDVDVNVVVQDVEVPAARVLQDAERRVISQLAVLDDDHYLAGLERLRALDDDTMIASQAGSLTLTATKR